MSRTQLPTEFQQRVVIENVQPEVDGGRFPIKRCPAEKVLVSATIHCDSSDLLSAVIQYRPAKEKSWKEVPLELSNPGMDLWDGEFIVETLGRYEYTVQSWVDTFGTWRRDLSKKYEAGLDVTNEMLLGGRLIRAAASRAQGADLDSLRRRIDALTNASDKASQVQAALDSDLFSLVTRFPDRTQATTYRTLGITVERERARYGAWYEMFPRSAGSQPDRAATLRLAEQRLMGIAKMGFDVLYLAPIHPIGKSFRKGPNNKPKAGPNDPGSPWAIGSPEGGHKDIEPTLGTLEDFDHFVKEADHLGLEIALDLAFQCSPDHPYVQNHPEWFRHRLDGTIQYAENPPKKYEDIYPLDFQCADWQSLWDELKDVVIFWIKRGVYIFRVDNPHTKPYRFWEWLIREVQEKYPKTLFLAEAFTRPKVMEQLAKCGFSQSYTYFTWRTTKPELTEYLDELTQTEIKECLRPNFFTNTPDILHEFLQKGGRPAFQIRLILAATLGANYGIYGPPFELCENRAVAGTEDYLDSEKYQIRSWDWDRPGHIKDLITKINNIRRENPALHFNDSLRFFTINNENLLCYAKTSADLSNIIVTAVNLDPLHVQAGWVQLPFSEWGLKGDYQVHDLLTDHRFQWNGQSNFVQLDPIDLPAHVLRISSAKP